MATKKELSKDDRIKKEMARLNEIFKSLEKNKLDTVEALINSAAFHRITLEDLQKDINKNGCVEEYQNGENQKGFKKSTAVDIHIAMTKNLTTIIKQLAELAPPAKKKESKLEALKNE